MNPICNLEHQCQVHKSSCRQIVESILEPNQLQKMEENPNHHTNHFSSHMMNLNKKRTSEADWEDDQLRKLK